MATTIQTPFRTAVEPLFDTNGILDPTQLYLALMLSSSIEANYPGYKRVLPAWHRANPEIATRWEGTAVWPVNSYPLRIWGIGLINSPNTNNANYLAIHQFSATITVPMQEAPAIQQIFVGW